MVMKAEAPAVSDCALDKTGGLRSFIQILKQSGNLRQITKQVDWKYEAGEITRRSNTPLLFQSIKDYPGHQLFTNGLIRWETIALALGFKPGTTRSEAMRELRRRITSPIPAVRVADTRVFDHVLNQDQLDLLQLPVPHWNKVDAARYIGTWHVNISRDPDDGAYNLGVYRMQVLGPRHATISTSAKSHLGMQFLKAEPKGKPLQAAVAIGVGEPLFMAAAAGYPCGRNEYELAGALQQKGVELLQCRSIDLEVPADAEILIEGHILPGVRAVDGPYFDYAGKATTNPQAFVFEATCLSYRRGPIFRGAVVGHRGAEDMQLFSVLSEVGLFDFHGSRARRALQIVLLREGLFRGFQWAGRVGPGMIKEFFRKREM
jgi:phenyl-phosphate phosphatase/carboxylase subunit alpha